MVIPCINKVSKKPVNHKSIRLTTQQLNGTAISHPLLAQFWS